MLIQDDGFGAAEFVYSPIPSFGLATGAPAWQCMSSGEPEEVA